MDMSSTGWGVVIKGRLTRGLWREHHLSWHISCLEMMAVFLALRHFLPDLRGHHVRTDKTSVVSYKSAGGPEVAPSVQTGASGPSVVPGQVTLTQSNVYPRGQKFGSRQGLKPQRMETPPRDGGVNLEEVRPSGSGFAHLS